MTTNVNENVTHGWPKKNDFITEETRHRLSIALFLLFGIEQRDGNAEWIHGEERTEVLSVFGDRQPANHDVVEGGLVTRKMERKSQLLPMKMTNHSPKPARQTSFYYPSRR